MPKALRSVEIEVKWDNQCQTVNVNTDVRYNSRYVPLIL